MEVLAYWPKNQSTPAEASLPWDTPTRRAASKLRASFQGSLPFLPAARCLSPTCIVHSPSTAVVLRNLEALISVRPHGTLPWPLCYSTRPP